MKRRAFLARLGGVIAAWPLSVGAQTGKVHTILWVSTEAQPDPFIDGFRDGMRQRGYSEGQNLSFTLSYAPGDPGALREKLPELLALPADLIVSSGPAIVATRAVTAKPVLFAISSDPITLGIAESLARPGRNFTGITFMSLDVAQKRVEVLKELMPHLRTLAVLSNPTHPGEQLEYDATRRAAEALSLRLVYAPFTSGTRLCQNADELRLGELFVQVFAHVPRISRSSRPRKKLNCSTEQPVCVLTQPRTDIDAALEQVRGSRADAILAFPGGATRVHKVRIAEFARAQGLPSMFGSREHCEVGGLASYGANQRATYVRLAGYADRLLRGERPSDLPIEQPTTFELVLNGKTARALGFEVPPDLLIRADEVIE